MDTDYGMEKDNQPHSSGIRRFVEGRTFLITGAGGSIGSHLVRRILLNGPRRVAMLDNSEALIFDLSRELKAGSFECGMSFTVGDIRDRERLRRLFAIERPQIVIHAAAYKHVPLMEEHAYEAFSNNIAGTRNVLEAAEASGAEHFVFISTDKAASRASLMGCTKRIGEMLCQHYRGGARGGMGSSVVRFGNVADSRGSVMPIFREQISRGGPLTVTHPEMSRYFMTIEEAARLVLAASSIGGDGEIFALEMGRSVRILDLARTMIRQSGREDIPIVFTGPRAGEQLSERLIAYDERLCPTALSSINRIVGSAASEEVCEWVYRTEAALSGLSDRQIATSIRSFLEALCVSRRNGEGARRSA